MCGVAFRECLLGIGAPGDTYIDRPAVTASGEPHIVRAFMGLTSPAGSRTAVRLQGRSGGGAGADGFH
ncbi:hypothetical protein GCM10020218_011340 [Dactylosporangium vinaceum]